MRLTVKLFASLRKGRFKEQGMEFPEGASVETVLAQLKIPVREVGIIFINGKSVLPDHPLKEGDVVSIFPLVGGG